MYLSKCKKCGLIFCDLCSEAAAELSGSLFESSETVIMHQPTCPGCNSNKIKIDVKE